MSGPYDDIIDLPHHTSATRPRMSRENRAAQFSPFAAVVGHDAAIKETGRLTDERITLGESAIDALDLKLQMLESMAAGHPDITVTYFQPDGRKEGGAYITVTGALKKLDGYEHAIILADGKQIAIEDIVEIECEGFAQTNVST